MIEVSDLCHEYRIGAERVHALKDVSFRVERGEILAIVGPSGSGKSTLVHVLAGLLTPLSGEVRVNGRDLAREPDDVRSDFRNREIGFVFQFFHLLPYLSAIENVEVPLLLAGVAPAERRRRAIEALERVGLAERARHKPGELSGGEMQRVSLARALVHRPSLLIADEPTGNLDRAASEAVLDLLLRSNQEMGLTTLVVTHQETVMECLPRLLRLAKGEIASEVRR